MRALSRALLVLALPLAPAIGAALDLRVPEQYPTIQAALDAAAAGDTVLVGPGRYVENVTIAKDVTVRSTTGAAATVIDGAGSAARVVSFTGGTAGAVLDGFTITNGGEGGVFVSGVPARIANCVVSGNSTPYYGGGIRINGGSWPRPIEVTDTTIENNSAGNGGGVWLAVYVDPSFRRCTIRGNTATDGGGLYAYYAGLPELVDSVVTGNTATQDGGGIYGYNYGWIGLTRSVLSGNVAGRYGGGGAFSNQSDVTTDATLVVGNQAGLAGGAFAALDSSSALRIGAATITGNSAPASGGLEAAAGAYFYVNNSIVWGNGAPSVFPALNPSTNVSTSDFEGGWAGPGSGNFDADPLFVDPAAGDYHLSPSSPCIDAGAAPETYGQVIFDMDGLPRPLGAALDVGADEYGTAVDADRDGWFVGFGECNDADPAINPGMTEIPYNGVDENCNGMADDDDLDHDGYPKAQDCNDQDASINPGAREINYDGIDQTCDGRDGAVEATWYQKVPHQEVNLGLAQCNEGSVAGNVIAFALDEGEQNADVDGDGTIGGSVLGYYDLSQKTYRQLGVQASWARTDGAIIAYGGGSTIKWFRISDSTFHDTGVSGQVSRFKSVSGGRIAYAAQATMDVNGDGYPDPEACVYDTAKARVTCTGAFGWSPPTISGNVVAMATFAGTIAWYDIAGKALHDTGIAGSNPVTDGRYLVFSTSTALALYDTATGTYSETPLKSWGDYSISDGVVTSLVDEDWYWGDLNGDGDRRDYTVLVFYDIANDRLVNTGIVGCCGPDVGSGIAVFDKYEGDWGQDLNGDGDQGDCIQHYVRLNTLVVTRAEYDGVARTLTVTATSNIDGSAGLVLDGYRAMSWVARKDDWEVTVSKVAAAPATVTVKGIEGSVTVPVTAL